MLDPLLLDSFVKQSSPEDVGRALSQFLPSSATPADKVRTIENLLASPAGQFLRADLGRWIVERFVPADALVPEEYANWRAPVRDAMQFVVSHLCNERLAPKLLEQIELPSDTSPEDRLLRLISKVPGLQKLGQVLARNRRLRPTLRQALIQLENGIHDVTAEQMITLIRTQLGRRLEQYDVRIEPSILSEASVSAVIRFTWLNPATLERERGVFKILKPYIPSCFAEDMDFLHGLANFFGSRYREYGFARNVLTDTFNKVRRLLRHEVNFRGEQKTLLEAYSMYRFMPKVRVPLLIKPLCTSTITAISEESGVKVTESVSRMPAWQRAYICEQLMEALIAVPLFASSENPLFHADPHAGNLLYDKNTGTLAILDWALTERLSRGIRRHVVMLVFMVGLRDPLGTFNEIRTLSHPVVRLKSSEARIIHTSIKQFFGEIKVGQVLGVVQAMRLLQQVAMKGVRFPAPLIMMSKVLFTLDGILDDIGGEGASMAMTIARHPFRRWLSKDSKPGFPLTASDLFKIQCSTLLYGGRMSIRLQEVLVQRLLPCGTGDHT